MGVSRMRRLAVAVGVLVVGVGAAGCGGESTTTTTRSGGGAKVLRYGVPASIVARGVSNPAVIPSTDGPILSIAYAPLFHAAPDGRIEPALAVRWRYTDDDQKVFEFTLREDARFSDGTPVTAEAVVGSLEYYYKSRNIYSELLGRNPRFEAVDRWTVRVTLTASLPNLPFLFSEANVNWGFVMAPKGVANPRLFTKATYGAGPYKLDYSKSVPGDHYTFVPNEYFYDRSAIKFKEIYLKAFADPSAALQAQQAGQIDVGWTMDSSTAEAAESAGLDVVSAPFAVLYMTMNARRGTEALRDVRVRRALNYAIDRKAISNALFGRYGVPMSQFTVPPDSNPGLENAYPYDPERARALLAEAGYPRGFEFSINTGKDDPQAKAVELVASYLDRIGVKSNVRTFQNRAGYLDAALSFKDDSAIFAGDVGVPTTIEYPSYIGPSSTLGGGDPVNPRVNELYEAGLRASDPSRDWKEMWAITVNDAWFLPISGFSDLAYVSDGIGGVQMTPARPYSFPTEWFPK